MKVLTETRGIVQALMNQLLELNKQNTGLQNSRYNTQSSAERGVICYSCKHRGHYARYCPSKSTPADRSEQRVKVTSQGAEWHHLKTTFKLEQAVSCGHREACYGNRGHTTPKEGAVIKSIKSTRKLPE